MKTHTSSSMITQNSEYCFAFIIYLIWNLLYPEYSIKLNIFVVRFLQMMWNSQKYIMDVQSSVTQPNLELICSSLVFGCCKYFVAREWCMLLLRQVNFTFLGLIKCFYSILSGEEFFSGIVLEECCGFNSQNFSIPLNLNLNCGFVSCRHFIDYKCTYLNKTEKLKKYILIQKACLFLNRCATWWLFWVKEYFNGVIKHLFFKFKYLILIMIITHTM